MRDQPQALRTAIATLYLRMRDARRRRNALYATQCPDSPACIAADATATEAWNSLHSVLGNVHGEPVRFESPRQMLDLAARRGRALARSTPQLSVVE